MNDDPPECFTQGTLLTELSVQDLVELLDWLERRREERTIAPPPNHGRSFERDC